MKILETEVLVRSKFLNFMATEYEHNGKQGFWTWATRPNNVKAVIIVAFVKDCNEKANSVYKCEDKLVVIKEFRVPLGDYEYGVPAGLIDGEEKPEDTAIRELHEETGLTVKKVIDVSPFVVNSAGLSDELVCIVYVECDGEISKEGHESSEDIETFLMSRDEVKHLIADKSKKFSAKAWIILRNFVKTGSVL